MSKPFARVPICPCGATRFDSGPAPDSHQVVEGFLIWWHRCKSCGILTEQAVPAVTIIPGLPPLVARGDRPVCACGQKWEHHFEAISPYWAGGRTGCYFVGVDCAVYREGVTYTVMPLPPMTEN